MLTLRKLNIAPNYYFFFNLSSEKRRKHSHNYLYTSTIYHLFYAATHKRVSNVLNDKIEFYFFCKKYDFHSPKVYAFISKDNWQQLEDYSPWDKLEDFILKKRRGSKGIGFVRFVYNNILNVYESSKITLSSIYPKQIEEKLKLWIQDKSFDYLIQKKLENHKAFSHLCNDALAAIRVLSMVDKKGNIQLFRPIFQMPQGQAVLNYYHTGALVAPIDIKTGRLGKLISRYDNLLSHHPQTKFPIEGLELPYWQAIKIEVKRFHHLLSKQPLIGWDIAVTPNGFSFLEGNIFPSLDIHQKPPFTPFIPSEFYELFVYHLEKSITP